ncbi:pre-mRNA cleavage factor Im 25 kDa subunit 1 isoform X3 [Ricinus communis]|uniref:pre-mRNA cleavage factor Im 25 kDa subunit 1 isoform X3 n=1 Tax=Ricinus communis TaxID=3988 RepID=UPI00201A9523|nr:pre-mRNA cleavage factor Im 25 kDa subunit 1 isoform X3 [Ricinus communis]
MSVSVKQDNATKSKTNVQQRAKASTIQGRTRTKLYKVHISKGHLLFSSVYFYLFIYCFFLFLSYFLVILRAKFEMGDHEVVVNNNHHEASRDQGFVLDIYPLSRYYFGSKDPLPFRDETLVDRVQRMKSNYLAHGLRTCVEAVILVGECLGMWWRPDFETLLYPYLPPNLKTPKECTKLFLVRLPTSCKFIVPKNLKLLAVPLSQIHDNHKTYGGIISGVPQLLSKYSFRIINS